MKHYCATVWINFKNPGEFVKQVMLSQAALGIPNGVKADNQTLRIWRVLATPSFWGEVLLLLLIPYPVDNYYIPYSFTIQTTNWNDDSGQFRKNSHHYSTPYLTSDIMLSLMLFRFYFIVQALVTFSPMITLHSKRIFIE